MRICIARLPLIAAMGVFVACGPGLTRAAEAIPASAAQSLADAEKKACTRNLEIIYEAITAYRRDKLDLPMWLSSLVPKYLPDANSLVCPVCRRTGAIEPPPLSDPKIPSSYLFEFCPVPLGDLNPKDPSRTRREWKRKQMGLIGSMVPIVRCRHHQPSLNLTFDGKIFEAPGAWELSVTNLASCSSLTASNLFASDAPRRGNSKYPARSNKATPRQVDLTKFYNAGLSENWLGRTNENFSAAPRGLQVLEGVTFDIRGLVQLAGKNLNKRFPAKVTGVPVGIKCKRLHFLHAIAGWSEADAGASAGAYVIKFAGNNARVEIPLTCGKDLAVWKSAAAPSGALKPIWTAELSEEAGSGKPPARARLFRTTWSNLAPELEIESIEIVSDASRGGLLVAAISAE